MRGLIRKLLNLLLGSQVTLWLEDRMLAAYSAPDGFRSKWRLRLWFWLYRLVLFLRVGRTFAIHRLTGKPAGQETAITVVYFLEGRGLNFLAEQIFGELYQQEDLGRCRFSEVGERAEALAGQADMIIIERNTLQRWLPRTGSWLRTPVWVRMVLDIDLRQPWEAVEKSLQKHANNIRRMKKAGLTTRISRAPEDFTFFYERMHVPFIHQRHQGYGITDSQEHLRSIFERGFLTQVCTPEGEVVAADLNIRSGEVHYAVAVGVLDASKAWLDAGALSAMYYYQIQDCHQEGIRRFDLGGARPFANNGLYQYKRRWGFRPVLDYWNPREWLFWVPGESQAARQWIAAHPFVPEFLQTGGSAIAMDTVEGTSNASGEDSGTGLAKAA